MESRSHSPGSNLPSPEYFPVKYIISGNDELSIHEYICLIICLISYNLDMMING